MSLPGPLNGLRVETLRLAALYSASGVLARVLSVPSGAVVAYFLGPFQLGLLAILRLIQQYVGYSHLGLLMVLPRNVPIAYGRGDTTEAREVIAVVYTAFLITSTAAIAALWGLFFAGITFKEALTLRRMGVLTAILITNAGLTFLRDYSKGEGRFTAIAKADVLLAVLLPLLTMPAAAQLSLGGVLLAAVATNVLTLLYLLHLLRWPRFHFRYDVRKAIRLLPTGALVFMNKVSEGVFWGIDLIVIGMLMAPSDVGYYSLALTAIAGVHPFLGAFNQVAYRQMMEGAGRAEIRNLEAYRKYAASPLFVSYLLLNSLLLGCAALTLMAIVRGALGTFAPAVPVMVVLTSGYSLYGCMVFMRFYLDATGQLGRRLGMVLGSVFVNLALDYVAIRLGYGLVGVACACTLSFLLNGAVVLVFCFRQIYGDWRPGARLMLELTAVSFLCMLFLFGCYHWVAFDPTVGKTFTERWLLIGADFAAKAAGFAAWCTALYFGVFRRLKPEREVLPVVRHVWSAVGARAGFASKCS